MISKRGRVNGNLMVMRSIPRDWPKERTVPRRPNPSIADVVADLEAGELDSLAAHIRDRRAIIDVQVALAIFDLIRGGKDRIGFRLSMQIHPDRSPNERSVTEQSMDSVRNAQAFHYYLCLREAQPPVAAKIAIFKTANEFELSESAVRRIISRGRETPGYRGFGKATSGLVAP